MQRQTLASDLDILPIAIRRGHMKSRHPLVLLCASVLIGFVTLTGCSSSPLVGQTQLEEQVIQIIRDNPDVVIESVQAYQQQKRDDAQVAQDTFAQQMRRSPADVIGQSPSTGATSNTIVLLEFSDFQCPFCAQAHQTVKQFMGKHRDEVTLVYKALPLTSIHPQALPAAKAAWAAQQQGQFWAYYDALFANQEKISESLYDEIARDLNLDMAQFERDRNSPEAAAAIDADIALAREIGLTGTPTFFLNGESVSGRDLSELEQVLTQVRDKAGS